MTWLKPKPGQTLVQTRIQLTERKRTVTRTRWQAWSWAAWMAVFGLVCAPSLSHAVASWQGSNSWVEVCSAQGPRRVAVDPSGEAVSPGSALLHHLSHCPLCGLSAGGMAPAPEASAWQGPLEACRSAGPASGPEAPAGVPGRDAQARAPPTRA